MTPEGKRLEGTLAHRIADTIWYCAPHGCDLYQPTPPLPLMAIVRGMRDYYAQSRLLELDPAELTPHNVATALRQLEVAGEATCDAAGHWTFVPANKSIFCDERMSKGLIDPYHCINRNLTSPSDILAVSDINGDENRTILAWLYAWRDVQFGCDHSGHSFVPDEIHTSGMSEEEFTRFCDDADARRRATFLQLIEAELWTAGSLLTVEDLEKLCRRCRRSERRARPRNGGARA